MDLATLAPHTPCFAVMLYAADPTGPLTPRERTLARLKLDQPTWTPAPEELPVPLREVQAWFDGLTPQLRTWVTQEIEQEDARIAPH